MKEPQHPQKGIEQPKAGTAADRRSAVGNPSQGSSQPAAPPGRPRSAMAVERVHGQGPEDEPWRPEATSASRHTRLADHISAPTEECSAERAVEVCGEVCRSVLGDFAPALVLLPYHQRRRAQALAAYCVTLFDFALQTGVEGERLAALNRWEFALDSLLSGRQEIHQPVFVLLKAEAEQTPWSERGFELLAEAARERVVKPRPFDQEDLERRARKVSEGLAYALLGSKPQDEGPEAASQLEAATRLAAVAIRTGWLAQLPEGLRRKRPQLPSKTLPIEQRITPPSQTEILAAVTTEANAIKTLQPQLTKQVAALPKWCRPAARYLLATVFELNRLALNNPDQWLSQPPNVGALRRVAFIAKAKVGR